MKKIIQIYLCLFILLLVTNYLQAQPILPDDPDINAPIDGGLSLLVAAGVGYGARKLKKNYKKQ